jgi:hypothetical protein
MCLRKRGNYTKKVWNHMVMRYRLITRVDAEVQLYTSVVYRDIVQMLSERCLQSK